MTSLFEAKKATILQQLAVPADDYNDLSPKGSIDESVRTLIDEINALDGLVTTSSCGGRISVFLEGRKKNRPQAEGAKNNDLSRATPGGKGGGGTWLFVSHDPIDFSKRPSESSFFSEFGLQSLGSSDVQYHEHGRRYIHLKFEPMILHLLTASFEHAQRVLSAANTAAFRESGAMGFTSVQGETNPMVAVRSAGFSFDSIIGYQDSSGSNVAFVGEDYLRMMVGLANERFQINSDRILRFRNALQGQYSHASTNDSAKSQHVREGYEDPHVRRQRKRQEGLIRQQGLHDVKDTDRNHESDADLGRMFD
ncbi:uncharacterized protein BDZ99DRAFT_387710 [Mytilinidion resinicola]|uniref:tRNA(Phe) 7-[(3-amino-3-carboxypropyl)-4-demethylwyosine(37)-N(4)]-methyltransferase n=1 Tax=Mytilinidion resinicola TaxID=574789 RepID=A0A6A6YN43_9PEZI|nr:uncharacterized protein BDZ99DRAFT_387710 [Mytilinidion resinicola]KAF2810003.1 hypothetical protein BDZ99DRAFT_387710 [Mytilinidion resinicola]